MIWYITSLVLGFSNRRLACLQESCEEVPLCSVNNTLTLLSSPSILHENLLKLLLLGRMDFKCFIIFHSRRHCSFRNVLIHADYIPKMKLKITRISKLN